MGSAPANGGRLGGGQKGGVGAAPARAAAAQGAALVLAARNEEALKSVCDDLTAKGARCAYVVADVGVCEQVQALADFAIAAALTAVCAGQSAEVIDKEVLVKVDEIEDQIRIQLVGLAVRRTLWF